MANRHSATTKLVDGYSMQYSIWTSQQPNSAVYNQIIATD